MGQLVTQHYSLFDTARWGAPVYRGTVDAVDGDALVLRVQRAWHPGGSRGAPWWKFWARPPRTLTFRGPAPTPWTDPNRSPVQQRLAGPTVPIENLRPGQDVVVVAHMDGASVLEPSERVLGIVALAYESGAADAYASQPRDAIAADLRDPELRDLAVRVLRERGELSAPAVFGAMTPDDLSACTIMESLSDDEWARFLDDAPRWFAAQPEPPPHLVYLAQKAGGRIHAWFESAPASIEATGRVCALLDPRRDDHRQAIGVVVGMLCSAAANARNGGSLDAFADLVSDPSTWRFGHDIDELLARFTPPRQAEIVDRVLDWLATEARVHDHRFAWVVRLVSGAPEVLAARLDRVTAACQAMAALIDAEDESSRVAPRRRLCDAIDAVSGGLAACGESLPEPLRALRDAASGG